MSHEDLADAWDEHAETYARIAAPVTGYLAQCLFQTVAGRLPATARILDVACGNGELSRAAMLHLAEERRKSGRCGSLVATDLSPVMVGRTRKNIGGLGADDLARCEVQDGQSLRFEDGSFDAVLSCFGIFLFPDRRAGWREAARVLRRGGLLATAVWRGPEHNDLARLQMAPVLAALPPRIGAALPRPSWLDIATSKGLVEEVSSAGFVAAEVSVFDAALVAPTPMAMWEMMKENPLTKPLLAACSEEEVTAVEWSARHSFEAMAGGVDRPVRFASSCHFLVARRA